MIARWTGRRRRPIAAVRRRKAGKCRSIQQGKRKKDEPLRPKEQRQLVQLVICGSVFVLLVAVKLLLPTHMAKINQALSGAMERNMDIGAVFSAVGDAFADGNNARDTAEEVYRAVFGAEEVVESAEATALLPEDQSGLKKLQSYRMAAGIGETTEKEGAAAAEEWFAETAAVLYSDQNLPEGVSMEQEILGFSYCAPVDGEISSSFGYREAAERFHYGVDLAADSGTDIVSFADGTVTLVGDSSTYGKYCIVSHEGGYSTLYAHCSRITAASGKAVQKGQKIAEVGETGAATGPHLHFELQRDGRHLNPIYYVAAT